MVFHNGSDYDYHFIIKELAEKFKRQFTCLVENTEKCITFTVPIEKEVDKNGEDIRKNTSYILQFIDSARFTASSLSKICRIKYKCCDCFLEYINFKDDLIEYKCLFCNKNFKRKFFEKWEKLFFNTYKFSNHDNKKFILL